MDPKTWMNEKGRMKYIRHYDLDVKIYPTGLCVKDLLPHKCCHLGGLETSAGKAYWEEVITVGLSLEAISCPIPFLYFLSAYWHL